MGVIRTSSWYNFCLRTISLLWKITLNKCNLLRSKVPAGFFPRHFRPKNTTPSGIGVVYCVSPPGSCPVGRRPTWFSASQVAFLSWEIHWKFLWKSTLNLYYHVPTIYGLYMGYQGGRFGKQTARILSQKFPHFPFDCNRARNYITMLFIYFLISYQYAILKATWEITGRGPPSRKGTRLWFQPIWRICSSNWIISPQGSGWK